MFESFFIQDAVPDTVMQGSYALSLVLLSYVIASFGSYTGLALASEIVRARTEKLKNILHLGGACALGAGIWSMHFIGMLAFRMDMPMTYDTSLTVLSMIIAITVAWGALWVTQASRLNILTFILGAVLLGIAVSGMHYTGMAAMRMSATLHYTPWLFALSVAIAIGAAGVALWIIFVLGRHKEGQRKTLWMILAGMVMGLGISGMHYTGMAAAVFLPTEHHAMSAAAGSQGFDMLAIAIAAITSVMIGIALAVGIYNREQRASPGEGHNDTFPARLLVVALFLTLVSVVWVGATSLYYYRIMTTSNEFVEEVRRDSSSILLSLSKNIYYSLYPTIAAAAVLIVVWFFAFRNLRQAIEISSSRVRRTEQELHTKAAHFRAAAEGTLDAFFLFRTLRYSEGEAEDFALEYMNPAAERMLDITSEDSRGKTISSLPVFSAKDIRITCIDALQKAMPLEGEYAVVSGPSAGHTFQQQIVPLPDGVAIMCRDITERKKMERMKNEFVSTVSHELRTPLTSIRGSLGLITGGIAGPVSDQAKNLLTIAYNNCERLVRLINDILDIEKIESGKMVFHIRPTPLLPLVRQIIETNQAFATKYNVEIQLETGNGGINTDAAMIMADSDRLSQVLTNLLSNAIKFSPLKGKVIVRCQEKGHMAWIEVEDHGQGIPKEFQPRIFGKFAQADSSDTRQKGGTGLGLSIVKALVQEMKGEIGFKTEEGKGTTFYFTLPLMARKEALATASPDLFAGACQRILVCEDEPDIAHLLSLILERAGFVIDMAPNATTALALLQKQSYLAMTLDLALPDKSGIIFIKELRADPRFTDLPIIVVSVKAEEGKQQMGGNAFGIIDWLSKPIDMNKLVEDIKGLQAVCIRPSILHVEDDDDTVKILRMSLQGAFDLARAATLKEARRLLQNAEFDLVILDIGLPDGQGTDLLAMLTGKNGKPVPVILYTGIEIPQEISAQVTASLIKSRTSEAELLETIQKIIAQRHPEKTAGQKSWPH